MNLNIDPAEFRRACRAQTRAHIQNMAGMVAAGDRPFSLEEDGEVTPGALLRHFRDELAEQAEPDGTRDIIACPKCGQQNRMPLRGAARCGKCKAVLQ